MSVQAGETAEAATAPARLDHLRRLEAESIHLMREVVAECERPMMLYSIGKDSSVMLHLALKAFHPGKLPFPLLHVASGWDFQAMLDHRDQIVARYGLDLIVAHDAEAAARGVNPFDTPTPEYTRVMLTETLKAALDRHGFDAAFGGGRRDEETSRAKERMLSFRTPDHRWDPKTQRPELWRLYNARKRKGETLRAFPLSNWTEADIWAYAAREGVPLVPLYLAAPRPTVVRDGTLLMVDDGRMTLRPGERVETRSVRFRTLGCWPLSGAIESTADTLDAVMAENARSTRSERQGRLVDHDPSASMERKKQEGYF